jgi:hypothetical protein
LEGVEAKLIPPAGKLVLKCDVGIDSEAYVVYDRYCKGNVDVRVGPCKEARSDHTLLAGGCDNWDGGGMG